MHTPKLKQHHSINRQQMARVPIPFSVRYFQAPALISIQRYCCFVLATEKDRESAKNFLHQKRRFLGVNVVEIIREEKKGGRMISIQRYCCFVLATEKDRESAKNFLHQKRRFLGVNVVEIIREEKKGGRMKMDMGRGMDAVAASSD